MSNPQQINAALCALASHLGQRREAILSAWRCAVDLDPDLSSASTSTRSQFVDHIPAVLDAFEDRLCAQGPDHRAEAREEQRQLAADHGMHRWQQGYNLHETMCEWGHLHLCLLQELERYDATLTDAEREIMPIARRELVRLSSDGVCASADRYAQLQQSEAGSRLRDLETALQQLRILEVERAEAWREAAHDLRGSVHVIANASVVLGREGIPDPKRIQASETLHSGVASLTKLLTDLMEHARLEAGHERRNIAEFDAAILMKDFCESVRPLAAERNLFLKAEGPSSLPVEGDAVKVQRILQNLVLNALQVTQVGGIRVMWEASHNMARDHWALCVQDTGPGFAGSSATPLKRVLKQATEEARDVEDNAQSEAQPSIHAEPAPTLTSQSVPDTRKVPSGEGIGLSIVKRLCELLDASLELESDDGKGTTFRVIFPRRYETGSDTV